MPILFLNAVLRGNRFRSSIRFFIRPFRTTPWTSLFIVGGMAATVGGGLAALGLGQMLKLPMKVIQPDGLVALYQRSASGLQGRLSYPLFEHFREDCRSCGSISATHSRAVSLEKDSSVRSVGVEFVCEEYFALLGLTASEGRLFGVSSGSEEDGGGVAVISQRLADSNLIGQQALGAELKVNGQPAVVIGVVADDFTGLGFETDLWLPLDRVENYAPLGKARESAASSWLTVLARLREDFDPVRADLEARLLSQQYQDEDLLTEDASLHLGPEGIPWTGRLHQVAFLTTILGGGACFALIALCFNLALVTLAKDAARCNEIAVKLALGARRRRLLAERALEAGALAILGGALSYLVAVWLIRALPHFSSALTSDLARNVSVDGENLAIGVGIAFIVSLASALPALFQVRAVSLSSILASSQSTLTTPIRAFRLRKWLVGAQVALCVILISAGILTYRSLTNMQEARVAAQPERLLFTKIAPSSRPERSQSGQRYLEMIQALESMSAIESATVTSQVPIGGATKGGSVTPRGRSGEKDLNSPVDVLLVGPKFFQTMGLRLLAGRDFDLQDREARERVVAVNETLARRYWTDGTDVLGELVSVAGHEADVAIVAVVEDSKRQALSEDNAPQIYLPVLQHPESDMVLLSRARGGAEDVAPLVHKELHSQGILVLESFSLQAHIDSWLKAPRLLTATILIFGSVVLMFSLGGVHSVVSLHVLLRRREIGLRLALGAKQGETALGIIRESFLLTGWSMGAGLSITIGAGYWASHILYRVSPVDPVTLTISLLLTFLVAAAAVVKPILQAHQIHPAELLRSS